MSCACIKKYFDLHVSCRGAKTMVIEDQSEWMKGESYDEPSKLELKVYVPSFKKEFTIDFDPQKRNLYTSIDFFGSDKEQCLPDDIYCFSVDNCTENFKISRAFICRVWCKLDELTSKAKTAEDFEEVITIKEMARAVEINARLGKSDLASDLLSIIKKKLKHITCASCS